ncbi:glutamyl-tRNA reductase [Streptoalloteichus hindustanus]|uniref:Glutamyl-tRNA reductase n=1 Tax=Streptoalloteichus hindustanus TaxID=2017 RepID=A0A1M4TX03_STRHI|nr:glutamyl-tRNA reductase [Streptoalloteichus hindustanus]SHE48946.1 glutamyl-tRNA reductase [Streptoalloteichus hindustanus]
MSLLAVGMSHRTAPVRVLERVAVSGGEVGKLLGELLDRPNVSEAVLVSTCNRVEVYAAVEAFHGGLADITGVLARHAGCEVTELVPHLYVHYAGAAAEHLFTVAAGLDSMVVGEAQILGQIRAAYAEAETAGTTGRVVHEVVQQALRVGKRVHAETGIDHAGASVVTEALADAERVLDGLAGRRALIVGAGSMAGLAAAHLRRAGVGEIVVANRTTANGERLAALSLAEGTPARAVPLAEVVGELAAADLLVACTGAVESVVDVDMVVAARAERAHPLVVCDLGLPRDVDPAVGGLPGVTVVDLETLQRRLLEAPAGADTRRAAELVAEGVRAYLAAQRSAEVTPTVTALRRRAAEVVDAELLRLDSRLPDLDATVRDELARTVRRVVDKLLHTPTVRVKELAAAPGGSSYADALRELFGLDSNAAAALTAPRTVDHGQDGEKR